jgi:hypothetical protein
MAKKLRILLLGEYSNYFNNLAHGLRALDHDVVLANNGDLFKNFKRDIDLSGISKNLITNTFIRIIRENIAINKMKGFDIVQIINPNVFAAIANNIYLYKRIFKQNDQVFLSAVGDDYYWWKAYRDNKFSKSPHLGFLEDANKKEAHWETFNGLKIANKFLANNCKAIIPGSISYQIPYKNLKNCAPVILQPIEITSENHMPIDHTKLDIINVYHGAQLGRYSFKGTPAIDIALDNLSKLNRKDLNIIRTDSLPFDEYLKTISKTHILIDQTNFIEPTMNALTSMLQGKVVLGGCEPIFAEYHNLKEKPLVNITDDPASIENAIIDLLDNREKMNQISTAARAYVLGKHDSIDIAKQFVACWKNYA